jgi:hypothetical protein
MQEYSAYIMGVDGHIELRIDLMCKDETEELAMTVRVCENAGAR